MTKKKTETTYEVVETLLVAYPDVRVTLGAGTGSVVDLLTEYIDHHKWLINQKIPYPITVEQAFFSWYETVFQPQTYAMAATGIFRKYSQTRPLRLFDEISKIHFQNVDEEKRYVPYEAACYAYICQQTRNRIERYFACRKMKQYYAI